MEELLNLLAQYIEQRLKREMGIPRARFTKVGKVPKGNYNFVASGRLRDSVKAFVEGEDIVVLMEDYGIDYVFSDLAADRWGISPADAGSFPGGGRYYPDTRQTRGTYSALIASLEKWVRDKIKLQGAEAKSMAFAIRKNLFKAGYKGLPLITDVVETDILKGIEPVKSTTSIL